MLSKNDDFLNFKKLVFSEKALELFKKIWISCVDEQNVLMSNSGFLALDNNVLLKDTFEYVKPGSATIGLYKTLSSIDNNIITKRDVIMSFAGNAHYEAMNNLYEVDRARNNMYCLWEYLISHILIPTLLFKSDQCEYRLVSNVSGNVVCKDVFLPISEVDDRLVHLIHFGMVVDVLDYTADEDKQILLELLKVQENIFKKVLDGKKRIEIDYSKIKSIHNRNYKFLQLA